MRFYEKHTHQNPEFPFYFHKSGRPPNTTGWEAHWHEALELLFVRRGSMLLHIDGHTVTLTAQQCFVVNSNCLHSWQSLQDGCEYNCLIVDVSASDWAGINVRETVFESPLSAQWLSYEFDFLHCEFSQAQDDYARIALKLRILSLITRLAREHSHKIENASNETNKRARLGRRIIAYLDTNFCQPLSMQDLCATLSVSESYACHVFRDATGMTMTEYLQYRRCRYAQRLLSSGQYNVSEAANESGFSNLSYFTRTYRRHLGRLPSADYRRARDKRA